MPKKPREERLQINYKASAKLTAYLYNLVDEEGLGGAPTTVAQNLLWQAIRQLISDQVLTRIPGKFPDDKEQ